MIDFPRWKSALILAVCAAFALLALPNFLSPEQRESFGGFLPGRTLNLGLDLQGGSHLLMQVDVEHYLNEQTQNLADELRQKLRSEKLHYRDIRVQEGTVRFISTDSPEAVKAAVEAIAEELELTPAKESGHYSLRYSERAIAEMQHKLLEQSIQIVDRRVNETGTREPLIQRQGEDRILVQVPGLQDPNRLKELLGKTAKMTFHLVDMSVDPQDLLSGIAPPGTRILSSDDKTDPTKYAVKGRVMLSGDLLTGASATYEQGQPVVAFKFNTLGARKFGEITQDNVGKPFAIVLDNKVITAPRINEPILGGSGIISGNFTVESANDLALLLRAGALPAPLKVIEERTVGPSLGADSIEAGKKASLTAILLIMAFMWLCYGRFGFYANVSLVLNMALLMGTLSALQATLTLPGIAGIVLTMGMAVDANVLIYERIREEIRNNKSPVAAISQGFNSAFGTIMDSNLTTLLAGVVLFYFGTGTIKGFAVTLSLGILTSVFSALLVTKMQVAWWFNRTRPKTLNV